MHEWLQLSDVSLAQKIDYGEKNFAETDPTLNDFVNVRAHLSRLAWNAYAEAIKCDRGLIARTGVMNWPLEPDTAGRLVEAFVDSPKTKIRPDDFALGYMASRTAESCDHLNRANDYHEWTPALAAIVDDAMAKFAPELERALGHPFRIVSSRTFDLRPNTGIAGRHLDGWPCSIRKVFLPPYGASKSRGTTWFRGRDGQEATIECETPLLLLFENSTVWHAPLPGQQLRPTIELDLAPATETVARSYYAGINGWYPWFPSEASFLEGTRAAALIAAARESRGWWRRLLRG